MKRAFAVVASLAAFAACGSSNGGSGGDDTVDPDGGGASARTFEVTTPDVTIHAHEEITYCYYFKTSNTDALAIKKWASEWTAGSHHVILYFASSLAKPEGTMDPDSCGFGGSFNLPAWIYSAQTSPSELLLPADDGAGKPVGMEMPAGQPAMLEVHYNNTGDEDVVSHATVSAEAYDAGVEFTKTYAYVTYSYDFQVPGETGGTGYSVTNTCPIPTSSKVWLMSTHAHKHAIHTEVRNGDETSTDIVFSSDDWEHPGAKRMDNPFYQFATGQLTNECIYDNHTGVPIDEGQSAKTNEMCMASGYTFPATKATFCVNGTAL